jgi:hypothetical protein
MKLKKIDIGIKGLEESLQDFGRAWKALESGKKVKREKGIYFDSIDTMRSVLTNNRLLVLKQSGSSILNRCTSWRNSWGGI